MENYLVHHGILGQKWGVRRYQNPDGSLTPAGRKKYNKEEYKRDKKELWNAAGNVRKARTYYNAAEDE